MSELISGRAWALFHTASFKLREQREPGQSFLQGEQDIREESQWETVALSLSLPLLNTFCLLANALKVLPILKWFEILLQKWHREANAAKLLILKPFRIPDIFPADPEDICLQFKSILDQLN